MTRYDEIPEPEETGSFLKGVFALALLGGILYLGHKIFEPPKEDTPDNPDEGVEPCMN